MDYSTVAVADLKETFLDSLGREFRVFYAHRR